jgi:hypothetical protein
VTRRSSSPNRALLVGASDFSRGREVGTRHALETAGDIEMEAVVLAAVLVLSVFTAGAGAFGALRLVMYLMNVTPGSLKASGRVTQMAVQDRPATSEPSLAA